MKMTRCAVLTLWIVSFCSISIAWSATMYISDQLVVSLRAQPQNNSDLIKYLRTDDKVDVIGEVGAFYKVKTEDNDVGFISKAYLVEAPPKPTIIKQLSEENENLKNRINMLEQQYQEVISKGDKAHLNLVDELKEAHRIANDLQRELDESKAKFQNVSNEFDTLKENAKNVVEITADRDQLRASNEELSSKLDLIEEEKFALQKSKSIRWFLTGAGVLFVGWIIGKSSKSRRRSSF